MYVDLGVGESSGDPDVSLASESEAYIGQGLHTKSHRTATMADTIGGWGTAA